MIRRHTIILVLILAVLASAVTACRQLGDASSETTLTVMTFNIGDRVPEGETTPTTDQWAAMLQQIGPPDVLLIQEAPYKVKPNRLAKALFYPYYYSGREAKPLYNNSAILSRYPLKNLEPIAFPGNPKKPLALTAEAVISGKKILFLTVQLSTLRFDLEDKVKNGENLVPSLFHIIKDEAFYETEHSRDIEHLLAWLDDKQYDGVIIGGDFNTFLFSRPIRAMNARFEDALWPGLDYFRGTYHKVRGPFKPRIDFLYHSSNIRCIKAEIIRRSIGDHYPVRAEFRLPVS